MKIDVYMPREDSHLLQKEVLNYAKGSILDMGAGSGIQAETAASLRKVKKVLAVDKSIPAVEFCRSKLKSKKIKILKSNLFSKIPKQKFDTIIFNPPYLPEDKVKHPALDGGKKGYEVLEKFLNKVNKYLDTDGIILIVFSSQTNRDKVDEIIRNNMFESKLLNSAHFFFEELFVYKIMKSHFLTELEKKKITDIAYFASGKRGLVYTGILHKRKVAIKVKNPKSEAKESIKNESKVLKTLNKHKIGPRYVAKGHNYLIYDFVEGEYIKDWLPKNNKAKIQKVFKDILKQCHTLDKLKVNKEEMHHPLKHIIIDKNIVMIDFERTHKSKSPKNVTQFLQFIRTNTNMLNRRGFNIKKDKILELSQNYKKNHKIDTVIKELGL
jgi:HemK-related putative methylase